MLIDAEGYRLPLPQGRAARRPRPKALFATFVTVSQQPEWRCSPNSLSERHLEDDTNGTAEIPSSDRNDVHRSVFYGGGDRDRVEFVPGEEMIGEHPRGARRGLRQRFKACDRWRSS